MKFTSLCRDVGIGANSYLLETGDARLVLDSGMHPKREGLDATPRFDLLEPDSVDAIAISHFHLDHVGTLPLFLAHQRQAKVLISPETGDLARAMLHNSVNVMQSKRMEHGISEYPLFGHKDVEELDDVLELRRPGRSAELGEFDGMTLGFHDAGHILGSVGMMIEGEGKRVFYTGDVNFEDSTIQRGADFPEEPVDALIVETTRGGQARDGGYSRRAEEERFAAGIRKVIERGGAVLIPVFAMGKTQEVLAMLHRFKEEGAVPYETPVYIGGLSTKMTHIYDRHADTARHKLDGFRFFEDMEIEGRGKRRRGAIPLHSRAIYALSSGMMSEKTVPNQFARMGILENKKNGLFFVGYADPETPGGVIRAAAVGDMVSLGEGEQEIPLRCDKQVFDFSGHAPREAILDYILRVKPKKTFLVHGDEDAMEWFRSELATKLPDTEVVISRPGETHEV